MSPRVHWRRKLVLVLVGLPARGKSYIAYKLMGYLRWRGLNANLFNVGRHRRQVAEAAHAPQSSDYFSASNAAASAQRDQIAMEVLDCMLDWLQAEGDVSIFDATNTTSARRHAVLARCQQRSQDLRVIFLESICDDKRVLELNYRVKAMNSPDYKNLPLEEALADLRMRVANYEKVSEQGDNRIDRFASLCCDFEIVISSPAAHCALPCSPLCSSAIVRYMRASAMTSCRTLSFTTWRAK